MAETFIARNGYTNLPRDQVRPDLDPESLDWGGSREKELDRRFNTLNPNAIGVKKGVRGKQNGWSIAFDYVGGGQVELKVVQDSFVKSPRIEDLEDTGGPAPDVH